VVAVSVKNKNLPAIIHYICIDDSHSGCGNPQAQTRQKQTGC